MQALPLTTEYLFTMDLDVGAPQSVSAGLRIVPVTGGTITGPALQGELLPGAAADWLRLEPDGTAHMDVRFTIKAASGSLVYVSYRWAGGIKHKAERIYPSIDSKIHVFWAF